MSNTIIANLKHAAWNKETVSIGGGTFDHKEVADFLGHYQALKDAVDAAKLLCANLERGGVGHQTLIDNFHICVDKVYKDTY